jgi:hypothetical protein
VIPALVAYQRDTTAIAHAVGEHSDRAFCGVWTLKHTGARWPATRDQWAEPRPACSVCAALVYAP